MHLSKVNEALDHKIVGGSEYCWTCWPNARFLDYESETAHASVVFNTQTQEVYSAEISDKENITRPYRWLNPDYKQLYLDEAKFRNVDPNVAWDKENWVDLETREDWLDKASAIFNGVPFDPRVETPMDLDNETILKLALMAHERDITINKMIEIALQQAIDAHKKEQNE